MLMASVCFVHSSTFCLKKFLAETDILTRLYFKTRGSWSWTGIPLPGRVSDLEQKTDTDRLIFLYILPPMALRDGLGVSGATGLDPDRGLELAIDPEARPAGAVLWAERPTMTAMLAKGKLPSKITHTPQIKYSLPNTVPLGYLVFLQPNKIPTTRLPKLLPKGGKVPPK